MKSLVFFILPFLLVSAIISPSITTLLDNEEKTTIITDFNEEEKNEEKKVVNEKDLFLDAPSSTWIQTEQEKTYYPGFYLENSCTHPIATLLPPPRHSLV